MSRIRCSALSSVADTPIIAPIHFSTPVHGVTAAFACMLDKSRTPVLKTLLALDRERILSSKIWGATVAYMGSYPHAYDSELATGEWALLFAAVQLGNFDAFKLLSESSSPTDGLLHLAAFLALPKFIRYLLKTNDANIKEEGFDWQIPLAVACSAAPVAWCKIANEEADFRTRQLETMQLLVPKTKLSWRGDHKTVMHIALDNGAETARAMLTALKMREHPTKAARHLYTDKAGRKYTLDQYVREICTVEDDERVALMHCLEEAGLGGGPW